MKLIGDLHKKTDTNYIAFFKKTLTDENCRE